MSAVSWGSRTKLKQLDGGVDAATSEHIHTTDLDKTVPFPVPALMAEPTTDLAIPSITPSADFPNTLVQEQSSEPVAPQMSPLSHVTEAELRRDDRSSSLSDIEDRPVVETVESALMTASTISEADDTEAETERLEESPQKLRKHENVVFTATQKITGDTQATSDGSPSDKTRSIESNAHASGSMPDLVHSDPEDDPMDQTSDISSLEDTAEEGSTAASPLSASGRKRKRSRSKTLNRSDSAIVKSLKQAAEHLASNMIEDNNHPDVPELAASMKEEAAEDHTYDDDEDEVSVVGGEDANDLLRPTLYSSQKSHRMDNATDEDGPRAVDSRAVSPGMEDIDVDGDAADSGGEDADLDDVAQGMGTEATVRNEEEVLKKKAALDSLGAIEKQFATLRDRLYEDRINHFNEELLMLNQPKATHPEYLAMVECIDKRREEKIMQANTRLRYKLETLQRKSIAERAIAHSQYMQTIREARDTILEQANKEWYQIQRERRTCDEDESLFLYQFTTRRSQQISRQAAYNTEVSILSGVAKYKGFPAAPVITPAKPIEIEEDLRKMGSNSQSGPARMTASLSNMSRQRPAAEEQFLEQTPWANPHHPVHHQLLSAAQRQNSLHSRPLSPFTTPAPPRRVIDTSAINGSASTITALQSAQNSSVAPTPASGEHRLVNAQESGTVQREDKTTKTPSKHNDYDAQESLAATSAARLTLENDNTLFPLLPEESTSHPEESQYASSPPSKARPISTGLGARSGPQPFGSNGGNADQHLESPVERNLFAAYQPQIVRQVSVSAGAEHGSA
ncbi:hypothetical protein MMC18_000914 [Xylographa bjoerkii]|nr:hypothetical protein [Xylographa bjoerkii]